MSPFREPRCLAVQPHPTPDWMTPSRSSSTRSARDRYAALTPQLRRPCSCLVGQEVARPQPTAGSASSTSPATCSMKCARTERVAHAPVTVHSHSFELEALLPPAAAAWRTSPWWAVVGVAVQVQHGPVRWG
jgi:hypothetical protein